VGTWIVFASVLVLGLAFMAWLGMFILSRGINLNLETDSESRSITQRQLAFGGILLAALIGLGVYYTQMNPDEILPEIGPGLSDNSPGVKEDLEKMKAGSAPAEVEAKKPATGGKSDD